MLKKLFKPFEELSITQNNLITTSWLLVILCIWIMNSLVGTTHLFPTISQVLTGFSNIWSGSSSIAPLSYHIISSLGLFFKVLFYSTIISCLIVYLSSMPIMFPLASFISSFRFLPLAGVTLYISFMIHNSRSIQVTTLVLFMSLFLITSLLKPLNAKSLEEEINHAKTIGCNRWEILYEVVIKGKLDLVIESIRQNLAIIWMMLVVIEMINTASGGLGFLIGAFQRNGSQGEVIALQIIILFIGKSLDFLLTFLRKKLFRYSNF